MTTKFAYRILVIVTVAFLAIMLSGCAEEVVNAMYGGSTITTGTSVQSNVRLNTCNVSAQQLIINEANGQVQANDNKPLDIATDDWLDSQMGRFTCIAERSQQ